MISFLEIRHNSPCKSRDLRVQQSCKQCNSYIVQLDERRWRGTKSEGTSDIRAV